MATLKENCGELEQVLTHAENSCQVILANLLKFDSYVGSYAVARLGRQLEILGYWIAGREHLTTMAAIR